MAKTVNIEDDDTAPAILARAATGGWPTEPDKTRLLGIINAYIDTQMKVGVGEIDLDAPVKDRLFDVLMARFDVLQDHRAGMLAIAADLYKSPCEVWALAPHVMASMARILDQCGLSRGHASDTLRAVGLTALYLKVFKVWEGDDSPDLSATMADLDRMLDRALSFISRNI